MNAYATKLAEKFSQKVIPIYFQRSVAEMITNQEYEGEIKDTSSILNILTLGAIGQHDYTGADMTADDIFESNAQLITDQQKYSYFKIKSLDKFKSMLNNPESSLFSTVADGLKKVIDQYILGLYTKVAAGNRIGTDYVTGTVDITTGTGAVVGTGTTFTAAMVGRGFKAVGHTKWYRVKTFTDTTHIVIENDSDDLASAYDGGTISGAAYVIEAVTAVQVTKSTIYQYLVDLKTKLDQNEIPENDRFAVLPAEICNLFLQAPELTPAVPTAYETVIQNGRVGTIAGFTVYSCERVTGNTASGWHCLAGHKSAITMATGFVETGIEDAIKNFGKLYKGLTVYGAKVVDERRKALTEGYFKL